jgi:predicted secreted protein
MDRVGASAAVVTAPRFSAGLCVALAALALVTGCDDEGQGIVFKDPKGTIDVEKGMKFTLEFSVNAGVGYDWVPVAPDPSGPVRLRSTSVDYPNEERAGDSGSKFFVYEATETGEARIELRKLFRGDQQERRRIVVRVRG